MEELLTCIPLDEEQRDILREISRVLRPGGLLYIGDLLLNRDLRNLQRYDFYAEKYGRYGTFELAEGVIVRHHREDWIEELTASLRRLEFEPFEATTMNGNKSAAFQYLCRVRPGMLSERAGMSKQAINQLLRSLENGGYIVRSNAPDEGRARVVRLTKRGHAAYAKIHEILRVIEREWSAELGPKHFNELKALLLRVWESRLIR